MNQGDRKRSPVVLVSALVILIVGVFALLTSGVLAMLPDPDVESLARLTLPQSSVIERP